MSKINLMYIISTLESCGPVNVLFNIVKFVDKSKFNVFIVELSNADKNSRKSQFEKLGCKVIQFSMSRIKGLFYNLKYLNKLIKENNIHIVHSHGLRADGLNSKLKSVKTFSTIHNYMELDYTMTYGNIKGKLMANSNLKYIEKINHPIGCSKSVKQYFKDTYKLNIEYIQNGVDETVFYKQENTKNQVRLKLNLPEDKKIFLVVGKLSERKNPIVIAEAFNLRNKKDEVLVFLGEGELKEELNKYCDKNENILLKGNVNNVKDYLIAGDYYISASLGEGLPNSALEALAMGMPSILSNIPPHAEILEYDKEAGKLFEANSLEELSKSIDYIYNKDYTLLSNKSKDIINKYLSAEIMSQKYQRMYLECLK